MEFLKNLKVDSGLAADRFCAYIQKKRNEHESRSLHAHVYSRVVRSRQHTEWEATGEAEGDRQMDTQAQLHRSSKSQQCL